MIDTSKLGPKPKTVGLDYDPSLENNYAFNILNGFRHDNKTAVDTEEQERKELLTKLEQPEEGELKRYTVTP